MPAWQFVRLGGSKIDIEKAGWEEGDYRDIWGFSFQRKVQATAFRIAIGNRCL